MAHENPENEQEQEQEKPYIMIEFEDIDNCNCRITPNKGVSLAQMQLAAFKLHMLVIRASNDRYTMEVQQEMQKQAQLQSIMRDATLKTQ